ncbi:MAG: type VII toxin-antitoxin system HepT family RNase toxin [Actinomycetota bacterium]
MIDKLLVLKRIKELENNLAILYQLRSIELEELSKSVKTQWMVFYGLQVCIQTTIDIGSHILAAIGENQIEEYIDIIEKLGKKKIIPEGFAEEIKGMPGLRNLLVHEYGTVDIHKVYDILQNNLGDFKKFISHIKTFLEKSSDRQ